MPFSQSHIIKSENIYKIPCEKLNIRLLDIRLSEQMYENPERDHTFDDDDNMVFEKDMCNPLIKDDKGLILFKDGEERFFNTTTLKGYKYFVLVFLDENTKIIAQRIKFVLEGKAESYPSFFEKLWDTKFNSLFFATIGDIHSKSRYVCMSMQDWDNNKEIEKQYSIMDRHDEKFVDKYSYESLFLNSEFEFGKYKYKTISEIIDIDEKYINDCISLLENFYLPNEEIFNYKPSFVLSKKAKQALLEKERIADEMDCYGQDECNEEDYFG